MDLSTIEGLELSEEQVAAITAQAKADIEAEVTGLRKNRDDLLSEKKLSEEAALSAKALAEAARAEADIEKARKANDLTSLEKTLTDKFTAEKTTLAEQFEALQGSVKASKKDSILSELSQHFVSPEAAKLVLKNMVDVDLNEGSAQTIFKGFDGNPVATDPKSFIDWAGKNESLSSLMKPINSAGGGASGNNGNGGANTNKVNVKAEAAKKSGDLKGFLSAKLNQTK